MALLARHPGLAGLELEQGHAEKETQFDAIRRGPRHHDLLVHGRALAGTVVIGVEGKADESFDQALDAWLAAARAGSPRTQAPERLDRLTRAFFGATLEQDPLLGTLRYQLLAALAGTLADARTLGAGTAVLLVHEFDTNRTTARRHARNTADLDAFVGRLMPGVKRDGDEDGWLAGPVAIEGDGRWLPETADVFVAKLVTQIAGT